MSSITVQDAMLSKIVKRLKDTLVWMCTRMLLKFV